MMGKDFLENKVTTTVLENLDRYVPSHGYDRPARADMLEVGKAPLRELSLCTCFFDEESHVLTALALRMAEQSCVNVSSRSRFT